MVVHVWHAVLAFSKKQQGIALVPSALKGDMQTTNQRQLDATFVNHTVLLQPAVTNKQIAFVMLALRDHPKTKAFHACPVLREHQNL
jgi:hypothetical protein